MRRDDDMVQAHVSVQRTAVVRPVHLKSSFALRKRCCKNWRPLLISCRSASASSKQAVQDDQVQLGKTGTHLVHSFDQAAASKIQCYKLTLHPTGITVNSLAIGAWQWGDISFWGYDTYGGYGEDEIRLIPGLLLPSASVSILYSCNIAAVLLCGHTSS